MCTHLRILNVFICNNELFLHFIRRELAWPRFPVVVAELPAACSGLTVPFPGSLLTLIPAASPTFTPRYGFDCVSNDPMKGRCEVAPKEKYFPPEPLEQSRDESVTLPGHCKHKSSKGICHCALNLFRFRFLFKQKLNWGRFLHQPLRGSEDQR